jgi:hypothetical protein
MSTINRRNSLLALFVLLCLWSGIEIRRATWDFSESHNLHWPADINNAFAWGFDAGRIGLFRAYDQVLAQRLAAERLDRQEGFTYQLDYPPLRLAIMTLWSHWVRNQFSAPVTEWSSLPSPDDRLHAIRPLLWLNLIMEIASAIGLYVLVLFWTRSLGYAVASALLLWFDPALITNAHAWPQWDVWCLPFFIWAVYLCLQNRWLYAGVLLAVGSALKGQLILVTPAILLWPFFLGNWGATLRLLLGFAFATAIIAAPFMLRSPASIILTAVILTASLVSWRWIPSDLRFALISLTFIFCVFLFGHLAGNRLGLAARRISLKPWDVPANRGRQCLEPGRCARSRVALATSFPHPFTGRLGNTLSALDPLRDLAGRVRDRNGASPGEG